jgi:sortase B
MFGQLTSYHHLNFAKSHPYIYYSTADQEMSWVVFAAFYTDVNFNYIIPSPDDAGLTTIINNAKARSRHIFNVSVSSADKILTLSTCTRAYGQSDRQRFVVMARLMHAGETFVPIDVVPNPRPVLPTL